MKKIFLLASLLLPFSLFAQQPQSKNNQSPSQISTQMETTNEDLPVAPPEAKPGDDAVLSFVEVMPEFPGGTAAMLTYLAKNSQYPQDAKDAKKSGRVYVSFIVGKEGQITDVIVMRNLFPSLDMEAVRLVKSMPNWKPGMQNGKPVRVRYNLPISFQLK
ncbi:MAG: energy transducer TonB [Bacteroidia bacterium]|nr:energy transducer TonB [Bacteroidia bacterium]